MLKKLSAIIKREADFLINKRKLLLFHCLLFPFIVFFFVIAIFSQRVISDIPIAIVDNDRSALSAELIRALNANPNLNIKYPPQDLIAARALMDSAKVFAILVIDQDYQKNILRMEGAPLALYINNQYLMVGSTVYKAILSSAETLAARYKYKALGGFKVPIYGIASVAAPLSVAENVLYNTNLDYVFILVLGLIPAIIQLFAGLTIIYSFLSELKYGRFKDLHIGKQKDYLYLISGKLILFIFIYLCVMMLMFGVLFLFFDLQLKGSLSVILFGGITFLFLTGAVSLLISSVAGRLALGLTSGAVYSAPAFAYFGVTFPVGAMPLLGRFWAELLPGTHFNRILVNETLRGGAALNSIREILVMLFISMLIYLIGSKLYGARISQLTAKAEGREQ